MPAGFILDLSNGAQPLRNGDCSSNGDEPDRSRLAGNIYSHARLRAKETEANLAIVARVL